MTTSKAIEKTPVEVGENKVEQEVTKVTKVDIGKDAHVEGTKKKVDTHAIAKEEK